MCLFRRQVLKEFKLQYFHQTLVCMIETANTVSSSKPSYIKAGVDCQIIMNGMHLITSAVQEQLAAI